MRKGGASCADGSWQEALRLFPHPGADEVAAVHAFQALCQRKRAPLPWEPAPVDSGQQSLRCIQ